MAAPNRSNASTWRRDEAVCAPIEDIAEPCLRAGAPSPRDPGQSRRGETSMGLTRGSREAPERGCAGLSGKVSAAPHPDPLPAKGVRQDARLSTGYAGRGGAPAQPSVIPRSASAAARAAEPRKRWPMRPARSAPSTLRALSSTKRVRPAAAPRRARLPR